jgi:Cysteine dioxygenase type I
MNYDGGMSMSLDPIFVPVLGSLDDLVRHEGLLSTEELEDVAVGIAERPGLWEPLVHADPQRRRYELVYEDDRMDAWILSWMPGQGTGFHDHYISGVGLCVARGCVREDLMVYGGAPETRDLRPGDSRQGGPGYIHRVTHGKGLPAVTVHVYSPRLDWVGQYRLGEDGVVRREVRPGRNELTEQLLAEGALENVLERF